MYGIQAIKPSLLNVLFQNERKSNLSIIRKWAYLVGAQSDFSLKTKQLLPYNITKNRAKKYNSCYHYSVWDKNVKIYHVCTWYVQAMLHYSDYTSCLYLICTTDVTLQGIYLMPVLDMYKRCYTTGNIPHACTWYVRDVTLQWLYLMPVLDIRDVTLQWLYLMPVLDMYKRCYTIVTIPHACTWYVQEMLHYREYTSCLYLVCTRDVTLQGIYLMPVLDMYKRCYTTGNIPHACTWYADVTLQWLYLMPVLDMYKRCYTTVNIPHACTWYVQKMLHYSDYTSCLYLICTRDVTLQWLYLMPVLDMQMLHYREYTSCLYLI
jgi:hypothetical protein